MLETCWPARVDVVLASWSSCVIIVNDYHSDALGYRKFSGCISFPDVN